MKKELEIDNIQKALNTLTDDEKQTLRLISLLCTDIDGVSLSNLCDIVGVEPHLFEKEVIALAKADLLAIQVNTVFPPTEVAIVLDDVPIPIDKLNGCISRLKTTLSKVDDLLQVHPFFSMAISIMKYVLNHPNDCLDYEEYGRLLVIITRHYEIFGEPDMSIHDVHDLPLWRGLVLAKSKIDDKSMLYARAFLLLAGFWYDESNQLLDTDLSIAHDDNETLAWYYFVNALWWENFGVIARCLEFAYKSWEIADESLKDYIAVYIGYQLSLLQEFAASDEWVNKIDIKKYPQHHTIRVYYYLTLALKCNDEVWVEDHLMRAECLLNQVNHQAPLKARVFYVRYVIYFKWGLNSEACQQYQKYANLLGFHYHSTEGAVCLYAAAEVDRLTAMGALIAAKHVIHNTLDFINLSSSEYALSVKTGICFSYVHFYLASSLYPLADVYYNMGKEFIEQIVLQEDTINVLRNIFEGEGGEIPASVSGDNILWLFEYEHLQTIMADQPQAEVKMQIDLLMKRFPSHQEELQVIASSLLNSYDAIHAWHMAVSTSEQSKRFEIALQCARIAVAQGLLWDGADFYNIVLNTDGYKALNKYQKIDILLEVAQTFEQCGERGKAHLIWIQLEALAKGTSKLADVFQARGNASYDHEQYHEALEYFNKCLAVVQSEGGLIDERRCSLHSYRAASYGALGDYEAAYAEAVQAKCYFPLKEFAAFNVEYNHGVFALFTKRYTEARRVLQHAKTLARTKEEKDTVDEQLSVLAMKKEKREAYLKQLLYNFDS